MSGIAGVFQVDGGPVDTVLLHKMVNAIVHRGPDGKGVWVNEKIGLGHRLLVTTEESIGEKQPLTNGRGLWITADCRIDNREELKREFQSRGLWRAANPPDTFYILLAYELWREEAPTRLIGDFSFAIWDENQKQLFCARDHLGLKPFVYYWDGKKFIFGSEMKQIFQDQNISVDLNLAYLADILARSIPSRQETPYQAIHRLPPGNSLRLKQAQLKIKRYWDWNPDSEPISNLSVQENAEKFNHIFQETIRTQLRIPTGYRSGSLLSGGLDSSSIAAVAASMQKSFPVFSLHFPEANPAYQFKEEDWVDETFYQQALLRKYPFEFHRVEIRNWGPFENLEETLWYQETPLLSPNLAYFHFLFRSAADYGIRSLFHGEGGDELFFMGPKVNKYRRKRVGVLLGDLLRSFLPEEMKRVYRNFFHRCVPPWMNLSFARKISLQERIEKEFRRQPAIQASFSYGIHLWISSGILSYYLETFDRAGASSGLEIRLPFLDRRLIQLAATLPSEQKRQGPIKKFLLREAMKDVLPSEIRNRLGKADFSPAVRTSLKLYADDFLKQTFQKPHPLIRSMTKLPQVKVLYNEGFVMERTFRSFKSVFALGSFWYIMSVDQWLKYQSAFLKKIREISYEKEDEIALRKG